MSSVVDVAPAADVPGDAVPAAVAPGRRSIRGARPVLGFVAIVAVLVVAWEAAKWIGGDPWRFDSFLGTGIPVYHVPPLSWRFASDVNLPHVAIAALLGVFCFVLLVIAEHWFLRDYRPATSGAGT